MFYQILVIPIDVFACPPGSRRLRVSSRVINSASVADITMVLTSERVNKVCNRPTPSKAATLDDPQDGAEPRDGPQEMTENTRPVVDYAASIEKVKDCGWFVFFRSVLNSYSPVRASTPRRAEEAPRAASAGWKTRHKFFRRHRQAFSDEKFRHENSMSNEKNPKTSFNGSCERV